MAGVQAPVQQPMTTPTQPDATTVPESVQQAPVATPASPAAPATAVPPLPPMA